MAIEIELKAWVKDPQELKMKLSKLAVFKGNFEKNDIYFSTKNPDGTIKNEDYGVRIRKEIITGLDGISKETSLASYKSKEIRDGIEINDEMEFEVSSCAIFELGLTFVNMAGDKKFPLSYFSPVRRSPPVTSTAPSSFPIRMKSITLFK